MTAVLMSEHYVSGRATRQIRFQRIVAIPFLYTLAASDGQCGFSLLSIHQ